MGADIHTTVGRLNKPMLTGPAEQSAGTALALFNNKHFQLGDFEFTDDIPREVDLNRSYSLFSFLAAVRGSVRPIMPLGDLMEATEKFLTWINDEHCRLQSKPQPKGGHLWYYGGREELIGDCATYDVGEHSRVFYPVSVLLGFDYSQVVQLENEDSDWQNPTYHRDPEGETYRDVLGDQLHIFLEWCVHNNWQFVIFGFDN